MTNDEWNCYCGWRDAFAEVLDPRYYTMEWLDGELLSGHIFFIGNDDGAIIYQFKAYPTGAVDVEGLIAAGELSVIRDICIPAAIERGRSLNCVGALISSRPGWVKALKASGFETHQVTIRSDI